MFSNRIFKHRATKFFFMTLLVFVVVAPVLAFAADYTPNQNTGIIPCDKNCTFRDFFVLAQNIINFAIIYIAVPLATLSVAIAGWLFLTSGANEANRSRAKDILWGVVIGFAIALAAWLVVDLILVGLVKDEVRQELPLAP